MMRFKISCSNPASQFLEIELSLENPTTDTILLQLPAWRAGRYQLANYAQNIRNFKVRNTNGIKIPFKKITKDRWEIFPQDGDDLIFSYEYWAGKMDAGSAWVDDCQIYANLVNCCFEVLGKSKEPIELILNLPDFPEQISTLIPLGKSIWKADDFQMLADSTILAAKKLTHWTYQIDTALFHVWINGEVHFDKKLFLERFEAFSSKLMDDFGEFPEKEYHFIFQLLPYTHYHGVEHRRGTVITFGPTESLNNPSQMEELLGISCHELYHAWNVCRIRPKELLPYDFSRETYTQTGLILEGITTYLGDLYLLKSKVYDFHTYLKHLNKIIYKEYSLMGWKSYSIVESSFDLWLDGYEPGIPDRKVNIYSRGALLSICLDILLLKKGSSLPEIMAIAWKKFGKPSIGYEWGDFEKLIREQLDDSGEIENFFSEFVYGYSDLFPTLKTLLLTLGLELKEIFSDNALLHQWGVQCLQDGLITRIHPESKAYFLLMIKDRIVTQSIHQTLGYLHLEIDRLGRKIEMKIPAENRKFFPELELKRLQQTSLLDKWMN